MENRTPCRGPFALDVSEKCSTPGPTQSERTHRRRVNKLVKSLIIINHYHASVTYVQGEVMHGDQ